MKIKPIHEEKIASIRELLLARGIEDIQGFLSPSRESLGEFTSLDNIVEGVDLLAKAITDESKILLVVDCDMDGYCSSAMLYSYCKEIKPGLEIEFICHEGKQHGLEDINKRVDLSNYDLVILPDAGSGDDEYFSEHPSTDFLILDHHLRSIEGDPPENAVLINNQTSPNYANKSLSGAGVTWQFLRALDSYYIRDMADNYLDLAAFAIIGDVMDISNLENRYIIREGLENVVNLFLMELVDRQSYSLGGGPLTPMGVAFYIVPLVNAMCRVGSLAEKERMFLAFVDGDALVPCNKRGAKGTMEKVSIESARECTNAKAKQKRMQDKMTELIEMKIHNDNLLDNKVLLIELGSSFDDIPSSINGLAATRLANKYNKPTLIGRRGLDNELKGSIRGLGTLDMPPLKDFLLSSGFFSMVEGHQLAAGYAIPNKKVDAFLEWSNTELANLDDSSVWEVDFLLDGSRDKIVPIIEDIYELRSVWGHGCPDPLLGVENINLKSSDVSIIGKGDTVKILYGGVTYMYFRATEDDLSRLQQYDEFELRVVGTGNLNFYMGNVTPQIFIKEFHVRDRKYDF